MKRVVALSLPFCLDINRTYTIILYAYCSDFLQNCNDKAYKIMETHELFGLSKC